MYTDLRDANGHLLARLDPERWLLEIQRRGEKTLIDLRQLLAPGMLPPYLRVGVALPLNLDELSLAGQQKVVSEALAYSARMPESYDAQQARAEKEWKATLAKHPEWLAPQSAKESDDERQGESA
jgi:hypothetical protein